MGRTPSSRKVGAYKPQLIFRVRCSISHHFNVNKSIMLYIMPVSTQPYLCMAIIQSPTINHLPRFSPCRSGWPLFSPESNDSHQHGYNTCCATAADHKSNNGILNSLRYQGQIISVIVFTYHSSGPGPGLSTFQFKY